MVEVSRFHKLDLLHVHYAVPHAISAYLAKQILGNGPRVITTLHGTDITLVGLEPSFLHLMKFSIEQSDGVTSVSRFLREKTLTNYGINKEIEVIPNFVDINKYKRILSPNLQCVIAPHEEKILMHTSNFRTVKVHEKIPSKLVLIGDGPERSNCEQLCRELNIFNEVKFVGKQTEIIPLLSVADLFLMPSQSESFGLSALEAMACEVPVISSSVGGLPELVVHGETGYIAEIGDIDRMAKYAVELLTNEEKHRLFANAARRRAVEHFDLDKIVDLYENHYKRVLEEKLIPAN
jgi:N-acetyl-alpha-D-glucosaminyl L-malate synthase BshA